VVVNHVSMKQASTCHAMHVLADIMASCASSDTGPMEQCSSRSLREFQSWKKKRNDNLGHFDAQMASQLGEGR